MKFNIRLGTDIFPDHIFGVNQLRYQLSSSNAQLIQHYIADPGEPGYHFNRKFKNKLQRVIDEKIEYDKMKHVLLGQSVIGQAKSISNEDSMCFFSTPEFDSIFPNASIFFDFTDAQLGDESNLPPDFLDWRDQALKESSDEESCHSHSDD